MSTTAQMSVHATGLAPSGVGGRSGRDRSVFLRKRASCRRVAHVASCSQSLVRSIGDRFRKGETSAEEVTRSYIAAIEGANETIGAFVSVTADDAIAQAKAVDAALRAGEPLGLLAGIPLGVKDNIATASGETSAGSNILSGLKSPYDARVIESLRNAGSVVVGKTNMDEFGMGSTTESSAKGATANPWDQTRVPGGSSGGSAAAVAAAQCVVALGSDTGGSIRQPASFCGVVGLKPTYGLVSRHGLVAYASSFDCIGPLASSVEDAAIVLSAIAHGDASDFSDATFQNDKRAAPQCDYHSHLKRLEELVSKPLAGKKFALVKETLGEGVDAGVVGKIVAAAAELEKLGAVVDVVSCPTFGLGLPAYYVLALSEASSNLARYDAIRYGAENTTRSEGLGAEVKRRILMGTYALSAGHSDAYYKRAQETRRLVEMDLNSKLSEYDALLTPAAPTPAYELGGKVNDPLAMFSGDVMTVNVNLAGLPAVVVRAGTVTENGATLPVGLQMVGRPFGEAELLDVAHTFEIATFDAVNGDWAFQG